MNNIAFEEFGSDADRLMRKLFDQTHKENKGE